MQTIIQVLISILLWLLKEDKFRELIIKELDKLADKTQTDADDTAVKVLDKLWGTYISSRTQ